AAPTAIRQALRTEFAVVCARRFWVAGGDAHQGRNYAASPTAVIPRDPATPRLRRGLRSRGAEALAKAASGESSIPETSNVLRTAAAYWIARPSAQKAGDDTELVAVTVEREKNARYFNLSRYVSWQSVQRSLIAV